jgi:hypothetical protein
VIDRAVTLLGNPADWSAANWQALGRAVIAVGEEIISLLVRLGGCWHCSIAALTSTT